MKPGDKVHNTMREKTGVIVSFPQVPTTCTVDYGDGKGPSVTTKAFLELVKPARVSRATTRKQLEAEGTLPDYKYSEQYRSTTNWEPEEGALDRWTPYFLAHSRLRITSSEPQRTAEQVSALLGVSVSDIEKYIEPCSETTHGAKFDIVVADNKELANAPNDLRLYFNPEGHSCRSPLEVQIGCRAFAEHLMKNGLVPESCVVVQ